MATGSTVEELLEQLIAVTKERGGGADTAMDMSGLDLENFKKQLKITTERMKLDLPLQKKVSLLLKGEPRELKDVSESIKSLDRELDNLEKATEGRQKNQDDLNKIDAVQSAKKNLIQSTAAENAKISMQNFGIGAMGVASTMAAGVLTFAKGLQSNASGVEVGTQALIDASKASGEAAGVAGSAISGLGAAAASVATGKLKLLFSGLSLAGEALGILGKHAAEASEKGITFLGDELKKTVQSYRDVTAAGVVLGGGMTEMRQMAYDAGLSIDQLAKVAVTSKEDLALMGVGMGEATKRLTGVSKELRRTELGSQLRNLGYGVEEQTELIAAYSARQRQAGETRVQSDLEVAKGAAQYGKDLKVLADITGKDAKAAMEKAADQAMEQDLMAEAMRKGGPEAMNKLRDQLATMPETMKKGYMEFVSTGGTAIADAATNVAISQNPKIMEQYKQQYQTLGDSNKKASDALDETGRLNEQTGKYAMEHNANSKEIAMASRLTGDTLTRGATDIQNDLIKTATRTGVGTTDNARKEVDKSATNTAPLDKAVNDLEESTQAFKAALGKETTGAITNFADTLRTGAKSMEDTLEELGLRKKSMTERAGEVVGGAGGAYAGGVAGAAVGESIGLALAPFTAGISLLAGPLIGAVAGGAMGMWGGSKVGGMAGKAITGDDTQTGYDVKKKPKMAAGGITQGQSIVGEAGPEAVVPLPNQKAIPVMLNAGNLADQLTESLAKKDQRGYGVNNTSYDDLPGEMQEWLKTQIQYNGYKKMTEESPNSKTQVSMDPKHQAKLDAVPKYLEDQNKILKEKYGRDIAQEYANAQSNRVLAMDEQRKKIYGDDINAYYSKLDGMTKMANGGITKGPSIAGEAGPEAVIPLVGGAVPVSISDKSFLMDSKKPGINADEIKGIMGSVKKPGITAEDIKGIIGTVIPPVFINGISKAVDFFTKPNKSLEMPKEMQAGFDSFAKSTAGDDAEIASAISKNADIMDQYRKQTGKMDVTGMPSKAVDFFTKPAAPPEMPKDMQAAYLDFVNSTKNDSAAMDAAVGSNSKLLEQYTQMAGTMPKDMQASNNKEIAMASRLTGDKLPGEGSAGKPDKRFDDITRTMGMIVPQVGMIGKAVDFFTKSDSNKESKLGTLDLDKQMQSLKDRVGAMPVNDMPRPNFDTAGLDDAMSPKMAAIYKSMADSFDATKKATVAADNINPGTDMGMGMGDKSNTNSNIMDSLKELPDLLKAMISRSDDQLQELRTTRNIQQQIANNY